MGIRGLSHSQITAILLWTTDSMAFDRWRSCARNPQKLGWATTPKRAAGVSGNPWAGEEKIISISVNIMYICIYIYVRMYIYIIIRSKGKSSKKSGTSGFLGFQFELGSAVVYSRHIRTSTQRLPRAERLRKSEQNLVRWSGEGCGAGWKGYQLRHQWNLD